MYACMYVCVFALRMYVNMYVRMYVGAQYSMLCRWRQHSNGVDA